MIYFTKVDDDTVLFQFYPKELPESVEMNYTTRVNHIEYNGGIVTNQIIGIFQEPVEFEGCFFGSYRENGSSVSAKDRAERLKSLMGIPLRCVFAVPDDNSVNFTSIQGLRDSNYKYKGDKMICIIEEFQITVVNHSEVDYRIKLTPHMNQKKVTPTQIQIQEIKIIPEDVSKAKNNVAKAAEKAKDKGLKKAGEQQENVRTMTGRHIKGVNEIPGQSLKAGEVFKSGLVGDNQ